MNVTVYDFPKLQFTDSPLVLEYFGYIRNATVRTNVRDFLGHANVSTTSRYLASSPVRLARALDRLESENASVIRTPFAQTSDAEETTDAKDSDKRIN